MWFMNEDTNEPPSSLPATTFAIRHDGWTVERQTRFLTALAACGCVREACAVVGMTYGSAYKLRSRASAKSFRLAWDAALDCAMSRLETAMLSRAIHGVRRPVFYKGEQVGEWRYHDERLGMFLLRYRRPLRFGSHLDRLPPPVELIPPPGLDGPQPPDRDEAMEELDWQLGDLEDDGDDASSRAR